MFNNLVTICKNNVSVTSKITVQFFGKLAQCKTCCLWLWTQFPWLG